MGRPAVLKIDIVADARKVGAGTAEADRKLGGLGGAVRKHGKAIALGLGVAVGAAGALGKASIGAASDLAETTAKTQVLFGKQSKAVQAYADTAAKQLGQSRQSVLDAASTFATFGKAAGLGGDSLVKFSTDFTGLASDLASFNNTSPEDAIQAIGAALRGEAEPMRRYGVLLNDQTLKQQALKMGLIQTTTQALTPQQKVLAAQAAIYAQTSAAQGDFARTSGGLANQQRILRAQLDNMQAQLGAKLLPITVKVTTAVVGLTTWLDRNRRVVVPVVAVLGTLAATVWLVNKAARAYAATQAALNIVMSLNPVGLVVIAVAALAAGIVIAWKKSETFRTGVKALWDLLKKLVGFSPFGFLLKHLDDIWNKVQDIGGALKNNPLTKGIGKVGGWAFGHTLLTTGAPRLVGTSGDLAGPQRRLATAAMGEPVLGVSWNGSGTAAGVLVVDRRDMRTYVRAEGAIDPVGTAETVARLLGDRDVRQGRRSAWGSR